MSNNKQSMKLYTEEHLKIFYHLGKIDGFIGRQDDVDELIKNYPPIKLPSDEGREEKLIKELITISWRRGFMNGLLAGSIICAIISTLIITIVL
jgi:hypothetical protein